MLFEFHTLTKTTGKFTVLYILIFTFLDSRQGEETHKLINNPFTCV
jgi:hypothetical protein